MDKNVLSVTHIFFFFFAKGQSLATFLTSICYCLGNIFLLTFLRRSKSLRSIRPEFLTVILISTQITKKPVSLSESFSHINIECY